MPGTAVTVAGLFRTNILTWMRGWLPLFPRLMRATLRALPRTTGAALAVGALIGIPWAFYHPPASGASGAFPLGPRPAVTVTESPTPGSRPASHPAPSRTNGASLSPVLALRISPSTATGAGGYGTASAGTTGGSGGSGGGSGGSSGGPQPSHAPSPAPSPSSPHPSPPPPPRTPGCAIHIGALTVCASVKIGVSGG